MGAPRKGLNPTTNSVGFTAKFVTVRSVSADGATAVVVDRQNTQTSVPMLVQRSKGPLPSPGDTWLISQDLGMWTFAAFVGTSDDDFAEGGPTGSQVTIAPTPPSSPVKDDVWFNSANGNQLSAWDGSAWVAAQFGASAIAPASVTAAQVAPATLTTAQLAADAGILASQVAFTASQIGGSRVFTGTAQPSGMVEGDLWFDSGSDNSVSVWTGEGWGALPLGAQAIAPSSLTGAQMADDASIAASQVNFTASDIGGVTVSISAASPSGPATGDLWYDSTNGYVLKQWNGSAWVPYQYGTGAISAGAITAELIAANTITASRLAAGIVYAGIIDGTIVEAATFIGSDQFFYSGAPGLGNMPIAWVSNSPTDPYGNTLPVQGLVSYESPTYTALFGGQIVISNSAAGAGANIAISDGGVLAVQGGGGISFGIAVPISQTMRASLPGTFATFEPWHNVAASSGFTVNTVQRYKMLPDNLTVRIQFNLASTNVAGTYNLFTLPAAYWPINQYDGPAPGIFNTDVSYATALLNTRFRVTTAGVVQIVSLPGVAINNVSGCYDVPLD